MRMRMSVYFLYMFHLNFLVVRKFASLLKKVKNACIIHLRGNEYYARYIGVKIGTNCRIYTKHFGTEPFLIEIGDNVTIAGDVKLVTHDGSGRLFEKIFRYRKIKIGNNVFIGMNSIVLLGVEIGNNVVVGAGSVLTKSVPSNSVVAGNPAKIISSFDDYVKRNAARFPYESDMVGTNHQDRVNSILDHSMRRSMIFRE